MNKRGQLALFVVLGIVIVTVIVLGIVFRSQIADRLSEFEFVKSEKMKMEESEIKKYASDCLEKVTTEGIQVIVAYGGYYKNARHSIDYFGFEVPHYLYEKKEYVPEIKDFKKSLARYIEENIDSCLASYSQNLELGSPDVEVEFNENTKVEVKQSLMLSTEETELRVSSYNAEVQFDINDVYDSTIAFYNEVKDVSSSDFLKQGRLALEEKYEFYVENIDDQESVYVLTFAGVLEEKDLELMFAIRFPEIKLEPVQMGLDLVAGGIAE